MKHISVFIFLILILTLGCAPKNSIESGHLPKQETRQETEQDVHPVAIPSLNDEETENKGEEKNERPDSQTEQIAAAEADTLSENLEAAESPKTPVDSSLPHLYEDAPVAADVSETPKVLDAPENRVGIGLAWLVGGILVFYGGGKAEETLLRLHAMYLKLSPTMTKHAQLEAAERMYQGATKVIQKVGLKKQIAERLAAKLIVTKTATGFAAKKGLSGFLGKAIGLGKWIAPFMVGLGVIQMVLEPTEVGGEGDELGPKDRFEDLKRDLEALEKEGPQDLELQDMVIRRTIDYLPDVIYMLEYESNQMYLAHEELKACEDVSDQDKDAAFLALKDFYQEQDALIKYFKTVSDSLKEIYYVEKSDRSKAEALIVEILPKLEAIFFVKQKTEKRERN